MKKKNFIKVALATAVIPCADFGAANCIRLSYAISMEDIMKGLDRIESFLNELA